MSQSPVERLIAIMAALRDPESGCPWDIAQTFASIAPSTVEEVYELVDAIERNDVAHLAEELGDVLFQVVFYARLGEEQHWFDFNSVVNQLADKLERRHPHVFAPEGVERDMAAIKRNWELTKQRERAGKHQHGVLDDIPLALPALIRAQKLQKRASNVGFDWLNITGVIEHLRSELDELEEAIAHDDSQHIAEELGDLLFCCVNLGRHLKQDAEQSLRLTNRKFEQRFRYIEEQLAARNLHPSDADLQTMDTLWDEAKRVLPPLTGNSI